MSGPSGLIRRIVFSLIPLVALYLVAEIATTVLYQRNVIEPESFWIYEENPSGWSYRFDPVRGYVISAEPSRLATTVSNGVIEAQGTIRGNNQGFPDRDDFGPRRAEASHKRLAVFGDSFTATQYIPRNWPDAVEDLSRESAAALELLNFSCDGGGLVNWWSVLKGVIATEGYELDGIVFAVYGDDLSRGYAMCDDSRVEDGRRFVLYGQVSSWQLPWVPQTLDEARPMMEPVERWECVSTERYESLLRGEWHPRSSRSFSPYLARRIARALKRVLGGNEEDPAQQDPFNPLVLAVIEEIRLWSRANGVPLMAVHVPWTPGALGGRDPVGSPELVQRFAELLQAEYVDGRRAFDGMSRAEIKQCWLKYDGHWTQSGSDRFAEFMTGVLSEWP